MRYKFKDFEFDSDSLVLLKNGEPLAIRHNEARVLALLLDKADQVLSKETILAQVWQDKVVSEQAVFQNISHLRSLFGSDAIKTFPKRGYQWQLALTGDVAPAPVSSSLHTDIEHQESQVTPPGGSGIGRYWPAAALGGLLLLMVTVIVSFTGPPVPSDAPAIELAYVPIEEPEGEGAIALADDDRFSATPLPQFDWDRFVMSAALEYPALKANHPFVLTGKMRRHQQEFFLDFLLKGPYGDWQGQLSGASREGVMAALQQHLARPFIYKLLGKASSPALTVAALLIAHQQAPEDLITLGALIRSYMITGQLEKAMVLADKLAKLAADRDDAQQLGNALLFQNQILVQKSLWALSEETLNRALAEFERIGDLKRQAEVYNARSWIAHNQKDYPAIRRALLRSAQLALEAGDQEGELDALTYLSVLAHKHHRDDDKYLYLQQAENKMKAYDLPIYQFAKVPYHHAIYAGTAVAKAPHLEEALVYTALTPDHWIAQDSRKQLMKYYIGLKRFDAARALLNGATTDNVHNSYLKALLAQAERQQSRFVDYARRTFELAQLEGETGLSLDSALMLCGVDDPQINHDYYSQYIAEHATEYWRRKNEQQLLALNLL